MYLDPPKEPTGLLGWIDRRTPYFWLYGICIIAFGTYFITSLPELMRPYSIIHERAAPYVWSPQCPKRQFKTGDFIELGCAREEYRFKDKSKKLLNYGRSIIPYYRIGNDLVPLSCGRDNCIVDYIIKDAYYQ